MSKINYSKYRWTVDEPKDFDFVTEIYSILGLNGRYFCTQDIYNLLNEQPDLQKINTNILRNEGYFQSLTEDDL